ncbi:MAG: DHH family phosphoesterase, partial [Treponema sp.]|nr:DHH family phosphoesterase [Treponema sp.]
MKKQVYIIGHRNPDTDSVVSAAAYARLKQAQGQGNCVAARAGNLSPQTEYIFNRFKAPVPQLLPDLIPKAAYYLSEPPATIFEDLSLWDALERMQNESLRVVAIVDKAGKYKSMLHYRGFANYIISHINPHRKARFPVSINHLVSALRAQPITVFETETVRQSPIVVAGSYNEYFKKHLEEESPQDALVVMGDRWDLQKFCIERKVRALILTNGHTLDREL